LYSIEDSMILIIYDICVYRYMAMMIMQSTMIWMILNCLIPDQKMHN